MHKPTYTRETLFALFEGHTQGLTNEEIAAKTGLPLTDVEQWKIDERLPDYLTVRRVLEDAEIRIRRPMPEGRRTTSEFDRRVAAMHHAGMSRNMIATKLRCHYDRVKRSAIRQGLPKKRE